MAAYNPEYRKSARLDRWDFEVTEAELQAALLKDRHYLKLWTEEEALKVIERNRLQRVRKEIALWERDMEELRKSAAEITKLIGDYKHKMATNIWAWKKELRDTSKNVRKCKVNIKFLTKKLASRTEFPEIEMAKSIRRKTLSTAIRRKKVLRVRTTSSRALDPQATENSPITKAEWQEGVAIVKAKRAEILKQVEPAPITASPEQHSSEGPSEPEQAG